MSGLLSAAQTFSFGAGMRWLSLICIFGLGSCCVALSPTPLDRDFGEDRHRDLFRCDGAEIEPSRRLDLIDRRGIGAAGNQLLAQHRHLATAADEGMILSID